MNNLDSIDKLINDIFAIPSVLAVKTVFVSTKQAYRLEIKLSAPNAKVELVDALQQEGRVLTINKSTVVISDLLVNKQIRLERSDIPKFQSYDSWRVNLNSKNESGILDWLNAVIPKIYPITYLLNERDLTCIGDALINENSWSISEIPDLIASMCCAFGVSSTLETSHPLWSEAFWKRRYITRKRAA